MNQSNQLPMKPSTDRSLTPVVERLQGSVVMIQDGDRGAGAGVIWRDNLIVTNHHVVPGNEAAIIFPDGEEQRAAVINTDPEVDLTALRAQTDLPRIVIGDSRHLRTGQLVVAIGHPLGIDNAVSVGIVSIPPEPYRSRELIAADIYLNRGNSGGPLADANGRVVGINAMIAAPGIGLAVPSHIVQAFLARSLDPQAYIGVTAQVVDIPLHYREKYGLKIPAGLIVAGIDADGPAAEAGLLPGDLILNVSGHDVIRPHHLLDEIALAGSGGTIDLIVLRGDERRSIVSRVATKV
jgi:S1-C subfamily serine protease